MSELHKDYIQKEYGRDIILFNEIYKGNSTPVNIGAPDSENFPSMMKQLVEYFRDSMPQLITKIINLKEL